MNHSAKLTPEPEVIAPLRAAGFFRYLQRILPLGRKYHRFISLFNSRHGLVAIPFGRFKVVQPASWGSEVAGLLFQGEDLTPEFRLLPPVLKELDVGHLVDVGANIGLYELMLRAHSPLPIIAYEPQPFLCELVRHNVTFNRLPQVDLRHLACGAGAGEIFFQTGINGAVVAGDSAEARAAIPAVAPVASFDCRAEDVRSARPVIRVPVTTLDRDLGDTPVALLKIDCEGFEYQILQGALNLLATQRPYLLVELHPQEIEKHGGTSEQLVALLRSYYDLEFWDFNLQRHRPRLVRSLLKHRRPAGYRFASEREMFAACTTPPLPYQVFILARPRRA